jgi:hypothetical protein
MTMIIRRDAFFAGLLMLSFAGFGCPSSKSASHAGTDAGPNSGTGGSKSGNGGASSSAASIKIDSPAAGASLGPTPTDPNYPNVPVEFTVKNFILMAAGSDMPAGTCAAGVCGHVHLLVDGAGCNYTPTHAPFNAEGADSPILALLGYCPSIAGPHVITLELHNDDESAVKDSSGTIISDKINVTAAPAGNKGDAG